MSDPYRRATPGEKLRISARAWNQLMDGLAVVPGASGETLGVHNAPYTWVLAKNVSGQAVARWGILAITGMESVPTASADNATRQFEQMPIVTAGAPSAGTAAWCVAVDPIPAGTIGRVAVAGAVQVKTADLSKASGAQVLWKNSQWALVIIGGGGGLRLGTISANWSKGATATVTEQNGDGTARAGAPTFTATNYFATVTVASGTKRVACGRVDDRWILIAAECS